MCTMKFDYMDDNEIAEKVLTLSIEQWNRSFGGISALDICRKLDIENEEVMTAMEKLCNDGKGKINANVELHVINFDTDIPEPTVPDEPTVTHVFFPSKKILTENFYTSDLVRNNFPEYKNRLHQGAHQLQLVSFSDEVLTRYFDHPEFYEIDDSLSGGHIWAKSEAPESRHLYVRHGKRKLRSGKTAVTAIFRDLYAMSAEEQRHWHAYEIVGTETETDDPNFIKFLARTYDGAFVDFESPIKDVTETLNAINMAIGLGGLFMKTENSHFRLPVEHTEKAFYDCCSEFYKLVGPDSINQKAIKNMLAEVFELSESHLVHAESGRPFSAMQLLVLLESKLKADGLLSKTIKGIGKYRTAANHKITKPSFDERNYVENFIALCEEMVNAGRSFESSLHKAKRT